MFYDETKTISACDSDPYLIFELLKEEHMSLIDKILSRNSFDINVCDTDGNNILMKLLKKEQFEIVLKHIKNKKWDVNNQNNDGDTFAHILVSMDNLKVLDIYKVLRKKKDFLPNIKNNKQETILDKSIQSNLTFITSKILEDSRFNEVGVVSFKKYYDTYIKNKNYGGYTKINNLKKIIGNLINKEVSPKVKEIIVYLNENFDEIEEEVMNNKTKSMDTYLDEVLFD